MAFLIIPADLYYQSKTLTENTATSKISVNLHTCCNYILLWQGHTWACRQLKCHMHFQIGIWDWKAKSVLLMWSLLSMSYLCVLAKHWPYKHSSNLCPILFVSSLNMVQYLLVNKNNSSDFDISLFMIHPLLYHHAAGCWLSIRFEMAYRALHNSLQFSLSKTLMWLCLVVVWCDWPSQSSSCSTSSQSWLRDFVLCQFHLYPPHSLFSSL